jgi:lipoprotein NlpD
VAKLHTLVRTCVAIAAIATLHGCVTRQHAPVSDRSERPPAAEPAAKAKKSSDTPKQEAPAEKTAKPKPEFHVVQKGDTLYSIAKQHDLNYQELAAWNKISDVNAIREGERIRLTPPGAQEAGGGVMVVPIKIESTPEGKPIEEVAPQAPPSTPRTEPQGAQPPLKTEPKAAKVPYSEQAFARIQRQNTELLPKPETKPDTKIEESKPRGAENNESLQWVWPTNGRIVASFSESSKGLDIAGTAGQAVLASADGRVSYIGNSLRGYGKMVVIIHNKTHLSLYAHNSAILVKEGQSVTRGQKIAEMGNSDSEGGAVKLHFEIRRLGKPVDPLKYLPPNERAS